MVDKNKNKFYDFEDLEAKALKAAIEKRKAKDAKVKKEKNNK